MSSLFAEQIQNILKILFANPKRVILIGLQISVNPIAAGDFEWIFALNCEETEQLRKS